MNKVLSILLLIITVFSYYFCPKTVDIVFMWEQIIIMLFAVFLFYYQKDHVSVKQDTLRVSVIFVFGFVVVYFQKDIDFLLGFTDMENKVTWYDQNIVCKCMTISNLTLQSFLWGYRVKKNQRINKRKDNNRDFNFYDEKLNNTIKLVNPTLNFLAYMMLFSYMFFVDKNYLFGGYGHHEMGIIADYSLRFAQAFIFASLAARCILYKNLVNQPTSMKNYLKFMKIPLFLSFLFVVLVVMSGARHLAIVVFSLNIIAFTYSTKYRFNVRQLVFGLVLVGSLITLRGIVRRSSYEGTLSSIDKIESVMPFTEELSSSIMTLHAAVSLVPDVYPYNYGLTLVSKPFLIIPGMSSLIQKYLGLDVTTANSGGLITLWVLGDDASFGMGSCSIADIYICFGLLGTLLAFFLWGYLLRFIENGLYIEDRKSVYFVILAFVVYSQAIYVSRESLLTTFQGLSYPLLFYYCFVRLKK